MSKKVFDKQNFKGGLNIPAGADLTLPKERGLTGITVDNENPVYTYQDLLGWIIPKSTGAGTPDFLEFRGGVHAYRFQAGDFCDFFFHTPHDHVYNSDMFGHVHYSHSGTAASGDLVLTYTYTYIKGHNQAVFPAPKTIVQTIPMTGVAQYEHGIFESQISSLTPAEGQIENSIIEPDGLLMARMTCTSTPTITGGFVFIFMNDLHYLSSSIGTKNKSPNFWT